MPNILIRDVPDNVYQMLTRRARQERRTIPSEVMHIVEQNLQQLDIRQAQHQAAIESLRNRLAEKPRFSFDISAAIREGLDE
jgi:plasmid stability protein